MSLTNVFFSFHGRLRRRDFWYAALVVLSVFVVLSIGFDWVFGGSMTWALSLPFYWAASAIAIKRYHDVGRSGWWLLLLLIPLIGPAWVLWCLGCRNGNPVENRYGPEPQREELDYLLVEQTADQPETTVTDVTGLYPVDVRQVVRPETVEDVMRAVAESTGPISIGGGRFSMGGQTASPDSLHIDMRGLNRVVAFLPQQRRIRVQSGIRWCDIQRFLDPHGLSVKTMQTYANFTVGGSLGVNAHGRYMGLGPVILSVREVVLVMADGTRETAGPTKNADLFYGAIGGYGGLGIIVEAELDVVENTRVIAVQEKLSSTSYLNHFRSDVRENRQAVFHNADLYPPHYSQMRSVTWMETDNPVSQTNRLMALRSSFPLERYFFWAVSETPTGKWRREFLIDPVLYFKQKVHWRNYEASYDVAELEPASRKNTTYVLQEYFVPVERFDDFIPLMAEVLQRHTVNVINISVRHAIADPGSLLAWAREEVFAFVIYYKQGTSEPDRNRVAVWTRELIDAALSIGGTYYLPYQPHATHEQFHRAYPRARELFAMKRQRDPEFRFRNALWDKYYAPTLQEAPAMASHANGSEFHAVFSTEKSSDDFYRFLQNIFHLFPEDKFHTLIKQACENQSTDREIYRAVQAGLPGIRPFLAPLTYALPALKKQKREMARQTLELLGERKSFDGYVEIGSTGRYISELRKHLAFTGPLYVSDVAAPGYGPGDIMERGRIAKLGEFLPLDYQPLDLKGIAPESVDLVTCYIGLHHSPPDLLDDFVRSVHRVLRPGGLFLMRDHDAGDADMQVFVSLVHTVFNLGLGVSWEEDEREEKHFKSADGWAAYVGQRGLEDRGARLLQRHDPSDNTLMAFVKPGAGAQA